MPSDYEPKYYLIAKTFAPVGRKFLLEDMVNRTSLTKQEAITALDYLLGFMAVTSAACLICSASILFFFVVSSCLCVFVFTI